MTKTNPYQVNIHTRREYWLARHPARIKTLQLAIEQNTKGKVREKALLTEMANRREHLAMLTQGDK